MFQEVARGSKEVPRRHAGLMDPACLRGHTFPDGFGEALGGFGGALGRLWEPLGRLWEPLGRLRGGFGKALGDFGEPLARLWEALGREREQERKTRRRGNENKEERQPRTKKTTIYNKKIQTPDQPLQRPHINIVIY